MASEYQWKEVSVNFTFPPGLKQYGLVKLKSGRVIYRNYHRELKNGNGLSLADILAAKVRLTEENMAAAKWNTIYS